MIHHMILTASDVEPSLAFYEAALKPLNPDFFRIDRHPHFCRILKTISRGRFPQWEERGSVCRIDFRRRQNALLPLNFNCCERNSRQTVRA